MNERIEKLAKQCYETGPIGKDGWPEYSRLNEQKFAELIVRECLNKIENEAAQYAEPVWAFELVNDIKEHFGVEE